ncbi:protein misato [Uranotaenia lowii]|uniref:protein misato n=1 Tax=Uranotaenia lowii TaxID=190385 RepID=UPI00247A3C24|nr:protein misato [Uranotaenia lowii]
MPREIVTFQLGNYSNYIGTHWWNIQEAGFNYDPNAEPSEIDHDVLFREGQTANRQTTFTPRLLLLDLKGTLKFMPEDGDLYSDGNKDENDIVQAIGWDPVKVEVIRKDPVQKCKFQKDLTVDGQEIAEDEEEDYNLKDTVEDWIDFSYTRYHPRSMNIVREYSHSNEENQFDTITNGMEVWEKFEFQDEFTDKIRQYVEECDACQGFQTIFDCIDGFAGIGVKTLLHLQDEYGKTSLAFPTIPPHVVNYKNADNVMGASIRVVNTALAVSSLIECCSLFVPLSTMGRCWRDLDKPRKLPFTSYEESNLYHTSALIASFLETISLRYRLKNPTPSNYLSSLCGEMTVYGRSMAAGAMALPIPMSTTEDLIDFLDKAEEPLVTSLTPNCTIGTNYVTQSISIRGIPRNRLKRPPTVKSAQRQQRMAAYRCDTISEMVQLYYQCQFHASMAHVTACSTPMNVRLPFPVEIFDSRVGFDGFLSEIDLGIKQKINSAPVLASLQSSGTLADTLDSLHREVNRIKIAKIPRYYESGLERENYLENLEQLISFKERYEDNYDI